jgi:hypothetical protein
MATRNVYLPDDLAEELDILGPRGVSSVVAACLREEIERVKALESQEHTEQRLELDEEVIVFDGTYVGEDRSGWRYYKHKDGDVVAYSGLEWFKDSIAETFNDGDTDVDAEILLAFGIKPVLRI